jgi:hypothetical protein
METHHSFCLDVVACEFVDTDDDIAEEKAKYPSA